MTLTVLVLAALTASSFGLSAWQFGLALRFPLHRRGAVGGPWPDVSILKPLKGCDAETRDCLRSWFRQDYAGRVELLLGVQSQEDAAFDMARATIAEHPGVAAQLVVCGRRLGPNGKVSTLAQLALQARHEVVCASDADMQVTADFLANVVEPLRDPDVGLVNCFYRLSNPANFAMRWEAFAVNADFWSQVLQSVALKPMDFALGAVIVTPRGRLDAIGGFEALVDYLADDYELGRRIASQRAEVALCTVVADCRTAPMDFGEVWRHQLRWGRTIRVCQPGPYFLSILGNATLWPLLLLVARHSTAVLVAAGMALAGRMIQGFLLERRMQRHGSVDSFWLAPVKDLLQIAIWAASFAGRDVVWRGERFRVGADGKLSKATSRRR